MGGEGDTRTRAERIRQGPRPIAVRVLIGYFVVFGFLLAGLIILLPFAGATFGGPYPGIGYLLMMAESLAFLVTGILLLNRRAGWFVAIALMALGALLDLLAWTMLFGGATVADAVPRWLHQEPTVQATALALGALYVVLRPDVRAFYGIGHTDVPAGPTGVRPADVD